MSVFLYEPFYDFDRLFEEAFSARLSNNQLQRQQAGEAANAAPRFLKPRMDLHEDATNNSVTASFELPGLQKQDVQIDVHNGALSVSAEVGGSQEREQDGYAIRERRVGKFRRTLQLPRGIKEDEIKASMTNGVLEVTFPKSAPELAPKKITIN